MNPHACLLTFLMAPAAATAFDVRAAPVAVCHHRSTPLTRMNARRGGKGRRRGRVGGDAPVTSGDAAAAAVPKPVRETPCTAAATATLAIQHAAHEDLLEVAYINRSILSPAVLSQALLRIAKVC